MVIETSETCTLEKYYNNKKESFGKDYCEMCFKICYYSLFVFWKY